MPLVKVEIIKGRTAEYKKALLDGIHSAMVAAFKIPEWDRMQRLYELEPDHMEITPTKTEQITLIEIIAFQGRSLEAKRKLYADIVANLTQSPGIPANDIMIVLNEPSLENWGIRGGKPASDLDIGFEIKV